MSLAMVILSPVVVEVVMMMISVMMMVVSRLGGPGPGHAPDVPHQGLVLGPDGACVGHLPARVAEVVEAGLLPAEVRPLLHGAHAT